MKSQTSSMTLSPGAPARQRQHGNVVWRGDLAGEVPPGLTEERHGMVAGADHGADFGQRTPLSKAGPRRLALQALARGLCL